MPIKAEQHFIFFFGKDTPFSNFHYSPFAIRELNFSCSEQAFMYEKAVLFNDHEIAKQILLAKDPVEYKRLGRLASNFHIDTWETHKRAIMYRVCYAKFSQSKPLKELLLSTNDKTLVEASKYDRIWGIGLELTDGNICNPQLWKGQNLLGITLMNVRNNLAKER